MIAIFLINVFIINSEGLGGKQYLTSPGDATNASPGANVKTVRLGKLLNYLNLIFFELYPAIPEDQRINNVVCKPTFLICVIKIH